MLERFQDDGILTLRLARGKANALDVELLEALGAELDAADPSRAAASAQSNPERSGDWSRTTDPIGDGDRPRAIILTAAGPIFSAGVDLPRLLGDGPECVRRFFALLSETLLRLFTLELPVVAAINGHAIAGGCLLAFACDYRIMSEGKGRIGLPELTVGLPFPAVGHEIVRFAVPDHRVQTLMYTGATLPASEAPAAGFVDEIAPPESLEARARAMAAKLGAMQPEGFRHTKRFLRAETIERLSRRGTEADRVALDIWLSPEAQGRVREYLARVLGK